MQIYQDVTTIVDDHKTHLRVRVKIGYVSDRHRREIDRLANIEWEKMLNRLAKFGLCDTNEIIEMRVYCWTYRKSYSHFGHAFVDSVIRCHEHELFEERKRDAKSMFTLIQQACDATLKRLSTPSKKILTV